MCLRHRAHAQLCYFSCVFNIFNYDFFLQARGNFHHTVATAAVNGHICFTSPFSTAQSDPYSVSTKGEVEQYLRLAFPFRLALTTRTFSMRLEAATALLRLETTICENLNRIHEVCMRDSGLLLSSWPCPDTISPSVSHLLSLYHAKILLIQRYEAPMADQRLLQPWQLALVFPVQLRGMRSRHKASCKVREQEYQSQRTSRLHVLRKAMPAHLSSPLHSSRSFVNDFMYGAIRAFWVISECG